MDYKNTLSVSQLTAQIKNLIESNYTSVIVRGEISNFTHHTSGHMYFTREIHMARGVMGKI